MLLTRQQFRAHLMTSKDETRNAMNHLRIDPTGRVTATNGHLAVIVTPIGRAAADEFSFPAIGGLAGTDPEAPVYVHREAALAAEKIIPKKQELAVLEHARLLVNGNILIGTTDLSTPQLVMVRDEGVGAFPDIAKVIPKGTDGHHVKLDPSYLALIAKYASGFSMKGVTLTVYGPNEAVTFEWEDERHQVVGLLMPMRDMSAANEERRKVNRKSMGSRPDGDEVRTFRADTEPGGGAGLPSSPETAEVP